VFYWIFALFGICDEGNKSHTKYCVKNPVDRDYFNYFGDPDTADRFLGK
jgi:hypothetical protein